MVVSFENGEINIQNKHDPNSIVRVFPLRALIEVYSPVSRLIGDNYYGRGRGSKNVVCISPERLKKRERR